MTFCRGVVDEPWVWGRACSSRCTCTGLRRIVSHRAITASPLRNDEWELTYYPSFIPSISRGLGCSARVSSCRAVFCRVVVLCWVSQCHSSTDYPVPYHVSPIEQRNKRKDAPVHRTHLQDQTRIRTLQRRGRRKPRLSDEG